jgi:hypothetical protein
MKKPSLLERLRAKKAPRQDVIACVVWYTSEEWVRVKASASDPEVFENTFSEWEAMAEEALVSVRKAVANPLKVFVCADELLPWCLAFGKENNAAGRSEFALAKSREDSNGSA